MPKSSFVDIEAVKAAITMEQVLQHYGLLDRFKNDRDILIGPCPIHKRGTATDFRINIRKNNWICLGECKHGGDALSLICILENISMQAAALNSIQWFKLDSGIVLAKSCYQEV